MVFLKMLLVEKFLCRYLLLTYCCAVSRCYLNLSNFIVILHVKLKVNLRMYVFMPVPILEPGALCFWVVRSVRVQVRVSMLAQAILPLASSVIVNCKSKILLPLLTQLNSTENYGRRCLTPLSPHRNYILS